MIAKELWNKNLIVTLGGDGEKIAIVSTYRNLEIATTFLPRIYCTYAGCP